MGIRGHVGRTETERMGCEVSLQRNTIFPYPAKRQPKANRSMSGVFGWINHSISLSSHLNTAGTLPQFILCSRMAEGPEED